MLGRINSTMQCEAPISVNENKYSRNEMQDVIKAIEYLYEFKEKLNKLHPCVIDIIENLLQRQRY